jgi:hypothetical protein
VTCSCAVPCRRGFSSCRRCCEARVRVSRFDHVRSSAGVCTTCSTGVQSNETPAACELPLHIGMQEALSCSWLVHQDLQLCLSVATWASFLVCTSVAGPAACHTAPPAAAD